MSTRFWFTTLNSVSGLDENEISQALGVIEARLRGIGGRTVLNHVNRTLGSIVDDSDLDSYDSKAKNDSDESDIGSGDEYEEECSNHVDEEGNPDTSIRQIKALHPTVRFTTLHCPPLQQLPMRGACNCREFGIRPCILIAEPWASDVFAPHMEGALRTCDEACRVPNNTRRKSVYGYIHSKLDFVGEEKGRKELPNCACAIVRQIYPNADGNYMGFLQN